MGMATTPVVCNRCGEDIAGKTYPNENWCPACEPEQVRELREELVELCARYERRITQLEVHATYLENALSDATEEMRTVYARADKAEAERDSERSRAVVREVLEDEQMNEAKIAQAVYLGTLDAHKRRQMATEYSMKMESWVADLHAALEVEKGLRREAEAEMTRANGVSAEMYRDACARADRLRKTIERAMQRANESAPGEAAVVGTIHDMHAILRNALESTNGQ